MAPTVLKEFTLSVDMETFLDAFWLDTAWYEKFLTEKLEDLRVEVGEWNGSPGPQSMRTRSICSYHPSKISFPGLPSHAESIKTQTMTTKEDDASFKMELKESNSFRGIPYADYFNVNTEWTVTSIKNGRTNEQPQCKVVVILDVVFQKSTWLQGTIESNTKAELLGVYDLWLETAEKYIVQRKGELAERLNQEEKARECTTGPPPPLPRISSEVGIAKSVMSSSLDSAGGVDETGDVNSNYYVSDAEEELVFFDCEEGEKLSLLSSTKFNRTTSGAFFWQQNNQPFGCFRSPSTAEELHDLYSQQREDAQRSAHDVAVTIVETVFVLAEFSFWRIHKVYSMELKTLFDIEPVEVGNRVMNSFLPGWHSPVLLKPDVYGPTIAVFTLPQVLLLSLEVSRSGCSQSALLGNAVVVSLCLWVGLSSLYRLIAFVIAPTIEFRHCLSMTGYTFFSWSLALLLSYPLEAYQDFIGLPTALPLVLFGLPSALALGCMFWEHTPASSVTLQPSVLPSSLQQCTQAHPRLLQNLLWAVPKILTFILVAGTHYQFLWYVARVFLPGRKQLCRLSALIQPSQYADILTQKELRKYALILLSGKPDN